jgi:hypothetical protein
MERTTLQGLQAYAHALSASVTAGHTRHLNTSGWQLLMLIIVKDVFCRKRKFRICFCSPCLRRMPSR